MSEFVIPPHLVAAIKTRIANWRKGYKDLPWEGYEWQTDVVDMLVDGMIIAPEDESEAAKALIELVVANVPREALIARLAMALRTGVSSSCASRIRRANAKRMGREVRKTWSGLLNLLDERDDWKDGGGAD